MRKLPGLVCVLASVHALAWTADWLSERGDPRRSGWQSREKTINPATVGKLKLIWQRKLADRPAALGAPTVLGRMVTHRGTVELIFVAASTGEVYAVDGDFGTVFWKRRFDSSGAIKAGCKNTGAPATALPPAPAGAAAEEDEDDDAPQPLRPLYVLDGYGRLHALHPGDGRDLSQPPGVVPHATNTGDCRSKPRGPWRIDVSRPDAPARLVRSGGSIRTGLTFEWSGREWMAGVGQDGRLLILDSKRHRLRGGMPPARFSGALATWENANDRWICGTTARRDSLVAVRLEAGRGDAVIVQVWKSRQLSALGAPVVAGGLVWVLGSDPSGRRTVLYALRADTGELLYSSEESIPAPAAPGALAAANGHISFTAEGTLYCFGFPVDI